MQLLIYFRFIITYFLVQLAVGGVLQPPLVCPDQQYHTGLNECAQSAPHRSSLQSVHCGLCSLHNVLHQLFPRKHWKKSPSTPTAPVPCGRVKQADKYPTDRRTESCWPGRWTCTRCCCFTCVWERATERWSSGVYAGSPSLTAGNTALSTPHSLPLPPVFCKVCANLSKSCPANRSAHVSPGTKIEM